MAGLPFPPVCIDHPNCYFVPSGSPEVPDVHVRLDRPSPWVAAASYPGLGQDFQVAQFGVDAIPSEGAWHYDGENNLVVVYESGAHPEAAVWRAARIAGAVRALGRGE